MTEVLVSSLPMLVCSILSVLIALSLYDSWNMARSRLLVFMVTATILYTAHYVYFNRLTTVIPLTDSFYSFCNPAVFPLFYIYIEELTVHRHDRWLQGLFLLPSVLCFLAVGTLYLLMSDEETTLFIHQYLYGGEYESLSGLVWWQAIAHGMMRFVFALQMPFVLFFGFQQITAYNKLVESNYSNIEGKVIRRMKTLLALFAAASIVGFIINLIGRQRFTDGVQLLIIPSLLFSILLLLIGHVGLSQQFSVQDIEEEAFVEPEPIKEDTGHSELLERIRKLVCEEQLFLYPNLKVSDLAKRLNSNRNYIYHAINVEMGVSFSDYINSQRVDYASRLIEEHPELPVSDVVIRSGFTSSSSFYRNFKKFKGFTPTNQKPHRV